MTYQISQTRFKFYVKARKFVIRIKDVTQFINFFIREFYVNFKNLFVIEYSVN